MSHPTVLGRNCLKVECPLFTSTVHSHYNCSLDMLGKLHVDKREGEEQKDEVKRMQQQFNVL